MGFSLVEVLLAGVTLSLIITALVGALLFGEEATMLGGSRGRAALLAEEGLEAVRNIADQAFTNLVDGTYGLAQSGGQWVFSGTSDTTDIFTRQIVISTIDSKRKSVTATVTWQQNPQRTGQVQLSSRFMNWRAAAPARGGLLAYADYSGPDDVIRYRTLSVAGSWSAQLTVPDFGVPLDRGTRRIEVYSSATRNEKILISKHVAAGVGDDQYLYAQVWNGTTWGNVVLLGSWSGVVRPDARDFDGAYLNNGDFIVVFEDETPPAGSDIKYRRWDGTSWTAATDLPTIPGAATADWIVVRNRPGTNEAMLATLASDADTRTLYFNGTVWGGAYTTHGTAHPSPAFEGVGFEWASYSGSPTAGALVFNEASDNFPNVRIYNTGTGTWGANVENLNIGGVARTFQVAQRGVGTEWLTCVKDSAADINCVQTDATPLWTAPVNAEVATSTNTGNQRSDSVAYEVLSGDRAVAVYSQGASALARATPKWRSFNPTTDAWTAEASLTALGGAAATLVTVENVTDTLGSDILVMMAGANATLQTIVWNGTTNAFYASGGRAQTLQGSAGSPTDADFWFDFAWDRF